MVQCEMCGAATADPKTIKVEGAELEVCADCVDFGTEVRTNTGSNTSTKYSTSSSSSESNSTTTTTSSSSSGGGGTGPDIFDDLDELAQDYDERVREAREAEDLSQEDLASQLNEKASLIRKIERGETLPSDDVQQELESELNIDLSAGGSGADEDWESSSAASGTTLGDVVERKE
ncbi:multiprotein bridging factor aMBF1 [Halococcoides cellulosivorans]|uniref:TIGR00270 family protein n=1 Tax=Halococcoides cellulosivorans TaxID=1679096 RepID=A0A2R4X0J0_9EURY|nr:multiprotein bridging factor aMBF1 [Halococcoides cellulosivorans]AWB27314.1 TIGR00270 family protein [Halococcoides cellulosivorans]